MKILLLGYGKMGRALASIAKDRGHEIVVAISSENKGDLQKLDPKSADVAIEFSSPSAAFDNISQALDLGIPVLSGSTGWLDKLSLVEEKCRSSNGSFFYSSNFSIGVNLFFRLNRVLADMMQSRTDYNIDIEETHHIHKQDTPSGTAITLAEDIVEHSNKYEGWSEDPEDEMLPITSLREGEIPGTHSVTYNSDHDLIRITHQAHSRQGFALGAMLAAEWMVDKQGILTMDDFLKF